MAQTYKKKLIEVAMPLEAINAASAKEKSIRFGHPSVLHLYWARRPLAACRAVIFSQLVDDPSSHPDKFPTENEQKRERERLFKIIEDLVLWKNSTNQETLKRAKEEIRKSFDGELPPIYDPFSGGGSIPLEAQRLGLSAHGSDLNPVAVMIGKAMIEIPPLFKNAKPINPDAPERLTYKNAEGLAEDINYYGKKIREIALERIGHLYPKVQLPEKLGGGEANVVAWVWARTIPSPDPYLMGLHVPLIRSFDLSTKRGQEAWVEPVVEGKEYRFEVRTRNDGFEKHNLEGTIGRQGGICLVSGTAMPLSYVREQAKKGKMSTRLMAIVAEGARGRFYLSPDAEHEEVAKIQTPDFRPDVQLPNNPRDFKTHNYGMTSFGDLFTDRQIIALNTFSVLVEEIKDSIHQDAKAAGLSDSAITLNEGGRGALAYADAISVFLAFGLSKLSDIQNSLCMWESSKTQVRHLFTKQSIPMLWNFAEANLFSYSAGDFITTLLNITRVVERLTFEEAGFINNADAQSVTYPPNAIVSTDPPYYDNIGYAELSDFFYIWLKPALKSVYPSLFGFIETPKSEELVATPYRHGNKDKAEEFFLDGMKKAIKNMAKNTSNAAPTTIYYAFKQSEIEKDGISSKGWATFLQAVIEAGYVVVGTWPMRTEMANRMVASGTNALANSVVLVCRKREGVVSTITRADFVRKLKNELPGAISNLKTSNISPADIPQSSIGPGIGIFSRYESVLEADDTAMTVKTALQLINRELGAEEGDYDAETSFALTWFEQFGFNVSDYGTANNVANAKGIAVDALTHAGIAQSAGGKFSLLSRDSLEAGWDPDRDKTVTIWECCQYLCRRLENRGEFEAAKLMRRMGPERADAAKELAYALYDIAANKLNDANEATSYNSLISAWSELTVQAANMTDQDVSGDAQGRLL